MSRNPFEQPTSQEQGSKSIPLSEQDPIERSRNEMVWNREQLKDLVELPLLKACEELYDKKYPYLINFGK